MHQAYKVDQQPRWINYNTSGDSAYLYEPLKNALKKYGDHHYHQYQSHIDNNLLKHSKVANNNRSLSPYQAQNIKASIIFPHNKTLVPTRHIQKVQGKVFVPLGADQKRKQPLSYNQFMRVKTEGFEQIVYEIQEQDEVNVYTYTTNMSRRTLPQQNNQSSLRKVYDLKTKQTTKDHLASHSSKNVDSNVRYQHYHAYGPEQKLDKSGKVGVLARQMPSFVQTLPRKYSYSINEEQNELIIEPNQAKPYNFSKKMLGTYNESSINAKQTSNKLNLFNIFDQCGNNGCNSQAFRSNEICASRVSRSNWK